MPHGLCYYTVSGSNSTKKSRCEAAGGTWAKWNQEPQDSCRFAFPGVSKSDFQLKPGQSDPECKDKH